MKKQASKIEHYWQVFDPKYEFLAEVFTPESQLALSEFPCVQTPEKQQIAFSKNGQSFTLHRYSRSYSSRFSWPMWLTKIPLFFQQETQRNRHEARILQRAKRDGVNVPTPVAVHTEVDARGNYTTSLVTLGLAQTRNLLEIISERELTYDECRKIGYQLKKLHSSFISKPDISLHDFALDEQGRVWIVSLDRARIPTEKHLNWDYYFDLESARFLETFAVAKREQAIFYTNKERQYISSGYALYVPRLSHQFMRSS